MEEENNQKKKKNYGMQEFVLTICQGLAICSLLMLILYRVLNPELIKDDVDSSNSNKQQLQDELGLLFISNLMLGLLQFICSLLLELPSGKRRATRFHVIVSTRVRSYLHRLRYKHHLKAYDDNDNDADWKFSTFFIELLTSTLIASSCVHLCFGVISLGLAIISLIMKWSSLPSSLAMGALLFLNHPWGFNLVMFVVFFTCTVEVLFLDTSLQPSSLVNKFKLRFIPNFLLPYLQPLGCLEKFKAA